MDTDLDLQYSLMRERSFPLSTIERRLHLALSESSTVFCTFIWCFCVAERPETEADGVALVRSLEWDFLPEERSLEGVLLLGEASLEDDPDRLSLSEEDSSESLDDSDLEDIRTEPGRQELDV